MMPLDVVFKYGLPPGEEEMRALTKAREVYGMRRIQFREADATVRVEYDGTRLDEDKVASILRRAGVDLRERVQLV